MLGSPILWLFVMYLHTSEGKESKHKKNHLFPPGHFERFHRPTYFTSTISPKINGSEITIPDTYHTPDYRVEEPPFIVWRLWFDEEERPYRISPHKIMTDFWENTRGFFQFSNYENPHKLGCYCCTVFKRLTPLAGCAVITTRHILTTATSTELILRTYKKVPTLENILGAWYDIDAKLRNSSMYMTPARIHYHPRYNRPENVNISHPVPCIYDLAVWTSTYRFYGSFWTISKAVICDRGGSHWWEQSSSTPKPGELQIIVGFQLSFAIKRIPSPFVKYAIRTRKTIVPCPKTDWGWFHCIYGRHSKFGVDNGAAQHRALKSKSWRYDGLIGMAGFSMLLRSKELTHYFHTLDTHPVLDFLYDAYKGLQHHEYLDYRFFDTKGKPLENMPWHKIEWLYPDAEDKSYKHIWESDIPYWRR